MRGRTICQIVVACCLALCHAKPQPDPEPEPDVNVNVNIDVNQPKGQKDNDINVDVNLNIDKYGNNSTDSVGDEDPGTEEAGCTCGKANKINRIINGEDTDPPQKYPWHVGLYSWSTNGNQYFCGGTIINNLFIISAAHCFYDYGPYIPSDILIGIGDHDQSSTGDDVDGITIKATVERVHIHPEYDDNEIDHDYSLIQLTSPLEFGDTFHPICLPENDLSTYEGVTGTIVGWGVTQESGLSAILQEAEVTIMDPTCNNYNHYKYTITENMLCASYPEIDTCQGDSGGSISVVEDEAYVIVGCTSWGDGCAQMGNPGVYSRITSVLRWIHQVCSEAEWCPRR